MLTGDQGQALPAAEGGSGSASGKWRAVVALIVACAVWYGVFAGASAWLPGARPERTWSITDGRPIPTDFVFLMFPEHDAVPIFDAPGGHEVGVLQRALGNDYGEVTTRQWIQVPGGGKDGASAFVRLQNLRYMSAATAGVVTGPMLDPAKRPNYVGNFAKAYMSRSPGSERVATFMRYTYQPDGLDQEATAAADIPGEFVSLTLRDGPNRRIFWAKATFEKATPLAIDRLSEGSRKHARLLRTGSAALLATIAAGVALIAGWTAMRR